MLAARAATDPNAASLLEISRKTDEELLELSPYKYGDVEIPKV
jgi:hypothetical protein